MRKIAMRCTQEQFEDIKEYFKEYSLQEFDKDTYLTNYFRGVTNNIANITLIIWGEEVHEQWDKNIFLEACGIETKPTLEEVKEYFKEASTVKDLINCRKYKINWEKVYFSEYNNWVLENKDFDLCYLWSEGKYAEIIEVKETKYKITKETILKYKMKDEFPEMFEVKLEVGKWYKDKYNRLFCISNLISKKDCSAYGFGSFGTYFEDKKESIYWELNGSEIEVTKQEVKTALINEAKKKGFKEGVFIKELLGINDGTIKKRSPDN